MMRRPVIIRTSFTTAGYADGSKNALFPGDFLPGNVRYNHIRMRKTEFEDFNRSFA